MGMRFLRLLSPIFPSLRGYLAAVQRVALKGRGSVPVLLVLFLVSFDGPWLLAWNPAGHMTIASMAYRQLPRILQDRCAEILRHHPNFSIWKEEYRSYSSRFGFGEFLFSRSSLWPDEIRGTDRSRPTWHYINYPLKAPDFRFSEALGGGENIVLVLQKMEKRFSDARISDPEKAVDLSWVVHLIADLHQPIHNATLITEQFPEGDRGGNRFWVQLGKNQPIQMHTLWDRLLGSSYRPRALRRRVNRLQERFPESFFSALNEPEVDVRDWSIEGRGVALEAVYLSGRLRGAASDENPPRLPRGYVEKAKKQAERQAALAAYRTSLWLLDVWRE